MEINFKDIFDTNNIIITDEFFGAINNDTEMGVFADAFCGEEAGFRTGRDNVKSKNFKIIWVNNGIF